MKIKFKHGDTKIEITFDNILGSGKRNESLEDMFMKYGFDFYSKLLQSIPQSLTGYYRELNGLIEKYASMNRANGGNTADNAFYLPASGHDIYNYVARYGMANYQIQAIMKLDGRLDFEKLKKAVRLSVDEEPVFACRFVEAEHPYWRHEDNLDEITFCQLEETDDAGETVRIFLEGPLDMDKDPMVKLKLIRSKENDILGLKVNHSCCDGGGIKEYIKLLSDIYTRIDQENGTFIPIPRVAGRKDQDRLFKELGIKDMDSVFIPGSDISVPTWAFPWRQGGSNIMQTVVCSLPGGSLDKMNSFAKAKGATINDMLMAASYRAMLEMGQPYYGVQMEVPITVDLRRYLPDNRTRAIRNFSGSVNTRLAMFPNESFNETLSRVTAMMNETKKGYPGLQSAIGLEHIEKISFQETMSYYQVMPQAYKSGSQFHVYCGDKCVPTLSNLGFISKSLIRFGNSAVTEAYVVPPIVRAPGLLIMPSTYNSVLTLAAGFYKGTVLREDVERLLNRIRDELLEGCKE